MSGNVSEWTCSQYNEGYGGEEMECVGKTRSGLRVVRGGSWFNAPAFLRSAFRGGGCPGSRGSAVGFRLARDL